MLLARNSRSDWLKVLLLTKAAKAAKVWAAEQFIMSLVCQGFFLNPGILAPSLDSLPVVKELPSSSYWRPVSRSRSGCTGGRAVLGRSRAWFPAFCVLEFDILTCWGRNKLLHSGNGKREDKLLHAGLHDLQEGTTTQNLSNPEYFCGGGITGDIREGVNCLLCLSELGRGKGWGGESFSSVKVAFCFEAATVIFHVLFGVSCF